MEERLSYITMNREEFKWCRGCNCFNSVDNSHCHHCGSTDFEIEIDEHIENETDFQAQAMGVEPINAYYTVK